MVRAAVEAGHPAVALTDHGNMSGTVELYRQAKKLDVPAFPGTEAYLSPAPELKQKAGLEKRFHLTMLARDLNGYRALVKLSSTSHRRERYHFKPRMGLTDFQDLAQAERDGLVVLTGCYFGSVVQALVNEGEAEATAMAQSLASIFPNLYVEVQHHDIDHGDGWDDTAVATALWQISQKAGLPVVVTQDSHYCDPSHRPAHGMMKRLFIHTNDPTEAEFPGDGYHVASRAWVRRHYTRNGLGALWSAAESACGDILESHALTLPALDKFKFHIPEIKPSPFVRLKRRAEHRLQEIVGFDTKLEATYAKVLAAELDVVQETGFAGYFDLVSHITDWCREEGIMVDVRGSANGWLMAYLLQITNVDPVKWDLDGERFLSKDRSKPPDIDLDVEDVHRDRVIEHLEATGLQVVQIGTYNRLSIANDEQGSLLVTYLGLARRTMNDDDAYERQFKNLGGQSLTSAIRDHNPADLALLRQLDEIRPRRDPGAHAAGFVVTSADHPLEDYIPTMLIPSSGRTVTQLLMDDVEDLGYVKVDLLGQRTLTALRLCQELIGRDDPTDLSWIPDKDPATAKLLSEGVPDTGIFQFEGYSMAKGIKQNRMRITGQEQARRAVSLFRTATLESGLTDLYFNNRKHRDEISYPGKVFAKHLKPTYGATIYQDQVLGILKDLGLTPGERNALLKAVKVKHGRGGHAAESDTIFDSHWPVFQARCAEHGMTPEETQDGWDLIRGFGGYGFNKAHATGYGIRAWAAAYLKAHHPLEYMAACLATTAGTPKEAKYIREARRQGFKILSPDVNLSGANWRMDKPRNGLRKALVTIKGVGAGAAEEIEAHQPYGSMSDLAVRTDSRKVTGSLTWEAGEWKGVLGALREAGALKSLEVWPE